MNAVWMVHVCQFRCIKWNKNIEQNGKSGERLQHVALEKGKKDRAGKEANSETWNLRKGKNGEG
jgi:hypothetical protein